MSGCFYKSRRYPMNDSACQAGELMISHARNWDFGNRSCSGSSPSGHDVPTDHEQEYTFNFADGWFSVGAIRLNAANEKERLDANGDWHPID